MRPWHVSIGLTVTALGVVAIFGLPELAFYKPHWPVLFRRGGLPIAVYGGIAVVSFAFSIYATARSLGLADLAARLTWWNARSGAARVEIPNWRRLCKIRQRGCFKTNYKRT